MNLSLESSVLKHFGDLEDPRIERTKHHPLISIVTIAILAVICGADSQGKRIYFLQNFIDKHASLCN
jgi:hypothetical protein